MAEIPGILQTKNRAGVRRLRKLSTRVDLTPMVDLGFLLLTFFIFTTTLSQPTAMKLVVPDDSGEQTPIPETGALTIIIGKQNSVFYYEGRLQEYGANLVKSSLDKIREIIIHKKRQIALENDFVVLIKPASTSSYKDIVDIFDEMAINDVKRYALVDLSEREERMVRN